MTGATSWGRRVAAVVPALVAGCAGAARPEPVSEPRPVASTAPVASGSVAAAKMDVGALTPALTTSPPVGYEAVTSWVVRYGRGVLRMSVDFGSYGGVGTCRLRGGSSEACAMFTVSTTGRAPAEDDWQGRPEPPDTRTSAPQRPPVSWHALSPGRDVLYGFAAPGEHGIDRIDERGTVTEWIAREALPESTHSAHVFEVGARRFVLVSEDDKGRLAEVREGKPGDRATLGPWSDVPITMVPPYRQSAQGIRQVSGEDEAPSPGARRSMVMIGAPVAVGLPAAGEWALVWIEGVAPPYKWPAGRAWKSPRKGRHECGGGPTSRPLTDVSIDKMVHLTRMRDTKVVSDVILRSDSRLDPWHPLQVRAVAQGVEVDGVTHALAGKAEGKGKAAPAERTLGRSTLPPGRDEEPQMLSFDAGSGQGVLVVLSGEQQWLRTFDARGAFVGEPVKVPSTRRAPGADAKDAEAPVETLHWTTAARQGDRWALANESGRHVLVMPGAHLIELPGTMVGAHFVKVGDRPHLVNVVDVALYEADVDLATLKVSEPVRRPFDPLPRQIRTVVPLDDRGPPTWLAFGQSADGGRSWKLWKLRPGATAWETMAEQTDPPDQHLPIHLLPSWSGPVLSFTDATPSTRLRWLRTGEERGAGLGDNVILDSTVSEASPLVTFGSEGQWGLVPSTPGPLVTGEADQEVSTRCVQAVTTGPTTAVLACSDPIEPMRPGVHAGLRLVTVGR